MKKKIRIFSLLLIMMTTSLIIPHDAYAGKYRREHGHSRLACWWTDVKIIVFGYVVREGGRHEHSVE